MTNALDELLAISRLPGSPLSYSPANATGESILQVALSQQDPNNRMIPGQHMIGTTIMGTDDGSNNGRGVVDTDCKVYGTGELLVRIVRVKLIRCQTIFLLWMLGCTQISPPATQWLS